MKVENLMNLIEKFMIKNNEYFFSYSWRENICNFLESESRYEKLVKWIDSTLNSERITINIFNPSDKTEEYTVAYFKNYKESCANIAMLLNFKSILLDTRTNTTMRKNIETSICKLFNIKYSDLMKEYIPN